MRVILHVDLDSFFPSVEVREHPEFADKFEQAGIDEAYLDISSQVDDFEEAREFARRLMEEVLSKENLTCSIGVAPNKMMAKIASDYKKPYGLTVVKEEDVKDFLFPLKARSLLGVGPKTESRLRDLEIDSIGDLAAANPEEVRLIGIRVSNLVSTRAYLGM